MTTTPIDFRKIPDKLYFKIGEVSTILELPAYVLRFWETEFSMINPKRTASGQRLYTQRDVAIILKIKHLLHERKYTIDGARQLLAAKADETPTQRLLDELRIELQQIRDLLD
jgi:DNA-binding transcriptional MerR regulator